MTQADQTVGTVAWFEDPRSIDKQLAGGKGANLAILTQSSFSVPPGFCITTLAHSEFLAAAGIEQQIAHLAARLNYDDLEGAETITEQIRSLIVSADVPEHLRADIEGAYNKFGSDAFVAVRSSATAEDLAEASFAGLHDSFLDVRGAGELIAAVKRCWASMWTARATIYRHRNGFEHAVTRLSVVVQKMIDAEVAGVLFTGNPRTTATDEMILNSTWGLGEALVQGIVGPDEYTVKSDTLQILDRSLGTKAVRTVRNPETGTGTVEEDVPENLRSRWSLSDDQVAELAGIARRVQEHYGDFPQDIEFALADGQFWVLQSRPITGVEFSWDADVDDWQWSPDPAGAIWTRAWADQAWTGAISPLFYSIRAHTWTNFGIGYALKLIGLNEEAAEVNNTRTWKFHKGEAYYNTAVERALIQQLTWPDARPNRLYPFAPSQHDELLNAPFSLMRYLRGHLKLYLAHPEQSFTGWLKPFFDRVYEPAKIKDAEGLSNDEVRQLSDRELRRYVERMINIEVSYYEDGYLGFVCHVVDAYGAIMWALAKWYDGDNPMAFVDLISGSKKRTQTQEQNQILWEISEQIRNSEALSDLFKAHQGGEFFARLEDSDDGRDVLATYRDFVAKYPHRGHDDRDIAYARRGEDPWIDYQALQSLLSAPVSVHPSVNEEETNKRREATFDAVVENMKRKSFGFVKAEAFKAIYEYLHRFIPARDDERDYADKYLYAWRRAYLEMGRRLVDRGIFDTPRDVFFLTRDELYNVLENGSSNLPLLKAKIAARGRDFDRFYNREVSLPAFMRLGRPVEFGAQLDASSGVFIGLPTSRGSVTGTARIVKRLKDIGRVSDGEILVCNSTDPGWTPVFMIIKGIVTETGGILSHAACLSREYGFPSVQLEHAMQLIPDGATVTVDGETGKVTIVDGGEEAVVAESLEPTTAGD